MSDYDHVISAVYDWPMCSACKFDQTSPEVYTIRRVAMLVAMPATAVTLGSLAALLPALGYDLLILNRTMREEGFLRNMLGGYAKYAGMVRSWIVPGLW